jgi:hypothetical protein
MDFQVLEQNTDKKARHKGRACHYVQRELMSGAVYLSLL